MFVLHLLPGIWFVSSTVVGFFNQAGRTNSLSVMHGSSPTTYSQAANTTSELKQDQQVQTERSSRTSDLRSLRPGEFAVSEITCHLSFQVESVLPIHYDWKVCYSPLSADRCPSTRSDYCGSAQPYGQSSSSDRRLPSLLRSRLGGVLPNSDSTRVEFRLSHSTSQSYCDRNRREASEISWLSHSRPR